MTGEAGLLPIASAMLEEHSSGAAAVLNYGQFWRFFELSAKNVNFGVPSNVCVMKVRVGTIPPQESYSLSSYIIIGFSIWQKNVNRCAGHHGPDSAAGQG